MHSDYVNGRRKMKTQTVKINGKKGFKSVSMMKNGRRQTSKKFLSKREIECIKRCQFIPGLFKDCLKKNITKNKKIGGSFIKEVNENSNEIEFEQKYAVINYGSAPISTYNLVNCIAIGGVFDLDGKIGTFLTHESPIDHLEQQKKLNTIKKILDSKNATITQIILFHIDKPSKAIYSNGLTTSKIISLMRTYCNELFKLEPNIQIYSCDISSMRCGKAIISPTHYNAVLTKLRSVTQQKPKPSMFSASSLMKLSPVSLYSPSAADAAPVAPIVPVASAASSNTFIVEVLYDKDGNKIYKCPSCNQITGSGAAENPHNTSLFSHNYNCPNKNKIPIES
jgi:hypothetical protein